MTFASLCYNALHLSGLTGLARRLRRGGVILCYHNVVPDAAAAEGTLGLHMPLPTFERQVRWLAGTYDVVSLTEFVGRLLRGASLRGAAAITFDDGYGGVFDHAWPLLRALGIPATVFVVAEAPEDDEGFWWDHPDVLRAYSADGRQRWLGTLRGDGAAIVRSLASAPRPRPQAPTWRRPAAWRTITDAAKSGLQLGAHSATHRSLPALGDQDLRCEVVESRDVIRRRTGVTPEFFAYPYGLWNDRVRDAVRSAGYRAAFTLEHDLSPPAADPWALPRLNVPAGIEDAALQAWTAGLTLRRGQRP